MGSADQLYDSETSSGDGMLDIHLQTADGTDFIIEMKYVSGKNDQGKNLTAEQLKTKMNEAAMEALNQIEEKKYDQRFKGAGNKIFKVALVVGRYANVLAIFEMALN
jgi:sorbitol-specific phosphotransferase system component IIBC